MTPWLLGVGLAVAYWFPIRRWFGTWGASRADRGRPMAGDATVSAPTYTATLAVAIDAAPAQVWPWLAQLGYQRGGLYSYDWLDRLFGYLDRPSAEVVLPEFQTLRAGDVVPIGRGGGFPVTFVDPPQALVMSGRADGAEWCWQFGVFAGPDGRTRLVSRNQVHVTPSAGAWLFMRVIEPAAFLMTRRMLLGIKRRAERLARAGPESRRAA